VRPIANESRRKRIAPGSIGVSSRRGATLFLIAAIVVALSACKSSFAPIYESAPNPADSAPRRAPGSPIPEISLLHFRIALAHLENDPGGQAEAHLRRALSALDPSFAIQIVPYNAVLPAVPAPSDIAAARAFLATSGAVEMVGGAVTSIGAKQLVRPVLVGVPETVGAHSYDSEIFRFPALDAADTATILRLAIAAESVGYLGEGICGHAYWRVFPLLAAARKVADRQVAETYWDRDSDARLNLAIAGAMRTSAETIGSDWMLRHSLVYSLIALADFVQLNNPHDSARAGWLLGSSLAKLGYWHGDPHYLYAAMDLLGRSIVLLQAGDDQLDAALAQDNFAYALSAFPGANGRKQRLEQALHIYQAVIASFPREVYPLRWRFEEHNIATTLSSLGELDRGNDRLDQSIAIFRALIAGLPENDQSRVNLETDFGHVLIMRASRTGSAEDLKEGIGAERAALKRLALCYPWRAGDAHDTLGIALLSLGVQQNSGDDLALAVSSFNSALTDYGYFGSRAGIATAQANLAAAQRELASRTGGATDLEAAVRNERAALRSLSRQRNPRLWAKIEARMGESLRRLGDEQSNPNRIEEAIAADRDALTIFTPATDLELWRQTESDLGNALNSLAAAEHGMTAIADAQASLAAFQQVLATFHKDTDSRRWAMINAEAAEALTTWGANESGSAHLEQAVETLNQSLALIDPHHDPATWAYMQNDLGEALATLGIREPGTANLERSAAAYRNALTILSKDKSDHQFQDTTDALNEVLAELKKRGKPNG
jgi:tetratricopeptide (TPR) repeat protein